MENSLAEKRRDRQEAGLQKIGRINKAAIKSLAGKVHNTDCIELMRSLRSKTISMIFADPPFNLNKKYRSYKDDLSLADYMEWTNRWLSESCRVLKDDGSLFIYNVPKLLVHTAPLLHDRMEFRHWIAWNSNGRPLGKSLQPAHYGILFYTKTKQSKFYDLRAPHPRCGKCNSYLKDYGGKERLRHPLGYQISDVWNDIHRLRHHCRRIKGHPCQLPVHLIERMMLMTTDENDLVLDLFCGGGSAAVAAKQMGRRYIGAELDPYYCEMANSKYSKAFKVQGLSGEYLSMHLGKVVSLRASDI